MKRHAPPSNSINEVNMEYGALHLYHTSIYFMEYTIDGKYTKDYNITIFNIHCKSYRVIMLNNKINKLTNSPGNIDLGL